MLLAPVITIHQHFELVTFYENIRVHTEKQYLSAHYDEFPCHSFTASFDFPRNRFFFFVLNIQSWGLSQLCFVNYSQKMLFFDVK